MNKAITELVSRGQSAPQHFKDYVDASKRIAERCGLSWEVARDAGGNAVRGQDWDMRFLNGSHKPHAAWLGSFAVNSTVRDTFLLHGTPQARLPSSAALSADVEDFVKAFLVRRLSEGLSVARGQALSLTARRFFSSVVSPPWQISRDEFEQFIVVMKCSVGQTESLLALAQMMDEAHISEFTPVRPLIKTFSRTVLAGPKHDERSQKRLPDKESFLELARIVAQEKALTEIDELLFSAIKIMLLTGLRINEVLMWEADCLIEEHYFDVVTGKSAEQIGGYSHARGLRYFAEKDPEGAPGRLVERVKWIPARFEDAVVQAVEQARAASQEARTVLQAQWEAANSTGSDLRGFVTNADRKLTTAELLFLTFKHAAPNIKSKGKPDVVAVLNSKRVSVAMGMTPGVPSLFSRYGTSACAKVRPHGLRHTLTTELFRLHVPDTIITSYFGRQSVAQSYQYDHRTQFELLDAVSLPEVASDFIDPGSPQELVSKMVVSGLAGKSHLAETFHKLQAEDGDQVAFRYLAASASGFHVTPYGFCVNSFSVDPCARHLKCFDGCKHFMASGNPEHVVSLTALRANLQKMADVARGKSSTSTARANQIAHAERLLSGVDAALSAQPNAPIFPTGADHSKQREDLFQ